MRIVAGLGNPGVAYEKSRHNAGYMALDALAGKLSVRVNRTGFSGVYGEGVYAGEKILLIKPTTYMNLSGDCVQRAMHFYRVPPENLIVLYDDVELPAGTLRIRKNGTAGTHNGMKSVIACAGSNEIPRIRIGVGREAGADLADYVLKKPSPEDGKQLLETAALAAEAAVLLLSGKLEQAQAIYNTKHAGGEAKQA